MDQASAVPKTNPDPRVDVFGCFPCLCCHGLLTHSDIILSSCIMCRLMVPYVCMHIMHTQMLCVYRVCLYA